MERKAAPPPPPIQPSPAPPASPVSTTRLLECCSTQKSSHGRPFTSATGHKHPSPTDHGTPQNRPPPPPPPGPAVPGLYQRVKYRSAPPAAMPPAPPRRRTAMTDGSERRNPIGTVPSPVVPGPRREEGRKARLCFFSSRTRPWVLPTVRKLNLEIKEATDPNPHHSKKQRLVQCFIFSSTQQYSNSYSDPVDAPKKRYF